jgi:cytoskeletal protein RodZ
MTTPNGTEAHDHLMRMILMIAACFAIGAIGFFLAVLLQRGAQATTPTMTVNQLSTDRQKEAMLNSASIADSSSTNGTMKISSSSATTAGQDPEEGQKLKLLQSLGSP